MRKGALFLLSAFLLPVSQASAESAQSVGLSKIETKDLRKRTRGRADTAFARQVAMYLAHVAYGLTLSDVGRVFERDRTTVSLPPTTHPSALMRVWTIVIPPARTPRPRRSAVRRERVIAGRVSRGSGRRR